MKPEFLSLNTERSDQVIQIRRMDGSVHEINASQIDTLLSSTTAQAYPPGQRGELLRLFDETAAQCRAIIEAKNKDYSGGEDTPYANFMASEVIGVKPELGLLMRCMDKFKRIQAFANKGELAVKDEPVDDAIRDVINYMVLLRGLINHNAAITASTE